eukprot:13679771-Alexandrium_andersonii.AAC.1
MSTPSGPLQRSPPMAVQLGPPRTITQTNHTFPPRAGCRVSPKQWSRMHMPGFGTLAGSWRPHTTTSLRQ